jgi:hypothetical protein
MIAPQVIGAGILVSIGIVFALVLILFGFILGRKTRGERTFEGPILFKPNEKPPEEDIFERALLSPEEGGYTDAELDKMARARPYEGM